MSQITDNGNGTVTISKEALKKLSNELVTTKADVELCVDTIARVLIILGIITPEGEIKQDFRFRHLVKSLSSIVTDSMFNPDSLQTRFSFITDPKCLQTIEKYSYLYRKTKTTDVPKTLPADDLEFEEVLNKP
jgi:hypothetical protein